MGFQHGAGHDEERLYSLFYFIFYLKTGYIAHNRHNRPKKARQSEKKKNKTKKQYTEWNKKEAKSNEQERALNKLLLFVCLFYN